MNIDYIRVYSTI